MRYLGWRRLVGDTAERPDLFDFGKKLLGQLEQQRKLGAPKTLAIQRELPDGSIVRARFEYEIPVIEVIAGGKETPEPIPADLLEGFVTMPLRSPMPDFPQVVVQESRGTPDKWRPAFYAAEQKPEDLTGPTAIYGVGPGGRPIIFGPPDGLTHFGNVDWRDTDEELLVSWRGPVSRYFNDDGLRGTRVYYKGSVLLDLLDLTDLLGTTECTVTGACLRTFPQQGRYLLVTARLGSDYNDPGRVDVVLRAPVSGVVGSLPAGTPFHLLPHATVGTAELLFSQAVDDAVSDAQHPWMFNQSGTQARCIRPQPYTQLVECILDVDDEGGVSYSESTQSWCVVTTDTNLSVIWQTMYPKGTQDVITAPDPLNPGTAAVSNEPVSVFEPGHIGYAPPWQSDLEYQRDYSEVSTANRSLTRVAVDFRDDVAVYASRIAPTYSRLDAAVRNMASTFASGFTIVSDGPSPTPGYLRVDWTAVGSASSSGDATATSSTDGDNGGLQTDWVTLTSPHSATVSRTPNITASSSGSTSGYGDYGGGTGYSAVSYDASFLSQTVDVLSDFSDTTTSNALTIDFLDLRYQVLVATRTVSTTANTQHVEGSQNFTYTFSPSTAPGEVDLPLTTDTLSVPSTADTATDTTVTTTAYLGSGEFEIYTDSTSTAATDTTPFSASWGRTISAYRTGAETRLSPVRSRTMADVEALDPTATFVTDAVDATSTPANDDAAPEPTEHAGAWCSYRGTFCYSQQVTSIPDFRFGLIHDAPSAHALTAITGIATPLFHPMTVLPATIRLR